MFKAAVNLSTKTGPDQNVPGTPISDVSMITFDFQRGIIRVEGGSPSRTTDIQMTGIDKIDVSIDGPNTSFSIHSVELDEMGRPKNFDAMEESREAKLGDLQAEEKKEITNFEFNKANN